MECSAAAWPAGLPGPCPPWLCVWECVPRWTDARAVCPLLPGIGCRLSMTLQWMSASGRWMDRYFNNLKQTMNSSVLSFLLLCWPVNTSLSFIIIPPSVLSYSSLLPVPLYMLWSLQRWLCSPSHPPYPLLFMEAAVSIHEKSTQSGQRHRSTRQQRSGQRAQLA